MQLAGRNINPGDYVSDIVKNDYRAADVFRKYGVDYCCGGKWPLDMICENSGLDVGVIVNELNSAVKEMHFSHMINYAGWSVDFMIDFITQVHHAYFTTALPDIAAVTENFTGKHEKKYPDLRDLNQYLEELSATILRGIQRKQEIIFPYIRQIAHAYYSKEPYARLLARTLSKPLEELMRTETQMIAGLLQQIRLKTNSYEPPEHACISHRVTFSKLKELDSNLQHSRHLEYDILFPRALAMERELSNTV